MLVLLAIALAAQRDFAHGPRVVRATATNVLADEAAQALRTIAWLDRSVLLLALLIMYLGLFVSRGH
jgi:hypothetical protein